MGMSTESKYRLAAHDVPYFHRLIVARRRHAVAVEERHAANPEEVSRKRDVRWAVRQVPDLHGPVHAAGGQSLAVGTERDAGHRILVATKRVDPLARLGI